MATSTLFGVIHALNEVNEIEQAKINVKKVSITDQQEVTKYELLSYLPTWIFCRTFL